MIHSTLAFLHKHAYWTGHIGFFSAVGLGIISMMLGSWQLLILYVVIMVISVPYLCIARDRLES